MNTKCQHCHRKSQLWLCGNCISELRSKLTSLVHGGKMPNGQYSPGWIEHLRETRLGLTRLGELVRHTRGDRSVRLNQHASQLFDRVRNTLAALLNVCEQRGMSIPDLQTVETAALWLAENVNHIATHETAGDTYHLIDQLVKDIEKCVDRPLSRQFCGPCPAEVGAGHNDDCDRAHPHECGIALMARRDDKTVKCPSCGAVHDVEELRSELLADLRHDERCFTRGELLMVLQYLGESVPARTFHNWVNDGKLTAAVYKRPDGGFDTWRSPAAKPAYKLRDVLELRAEKRDKKLAAAGARKR